MDAVSGIVSATSKLNREVASSYTMNIRVSDNGKPSLFANVPVTVNVEDINDNTPVFSKTVYTSNIREDSAVGSNIVQVRIHIQLLFLNQSAGDLKSWYREAKIWKIINIETKQASTLNLFKKGI